MDLSFLTHNVGGITLALVLVLIVTTWIITSRRRRHLKLPPGPPGWPIIGNLPVLFKHPGSSYKDYYFSKCSRKYGGIFKLRFGLQTMYVLSDIDHVREVFSNSKVQGRQPSAAYELAIGPGAKGTVFASGPEWSAMRKFTLHLFRDLGVGRGFFNDTIQLEVERLTKVFDHQSSSPNEPCWGAYKLFYAAIGNIVAGITFGYTSDYEDAEFKEVIRVVDSISKLLGPGAMVIASKTLCKLPLGPGKALMTELLQFKNLLQDRINKTKAMLESGDQVNSFVKAFLEEMEEGKEFFDEDNLMTGCMELFFAGTDTTASTLAFALQFLTTHPDVQLKCQRELDQHVEEHGIPTYSDRSKLPYTQAVILECERLASVSVLGIPHRVTEDLNLLGYDFQKGTVVIANNESMNMDEKRFPEPSNFRPERFLDDEGFEVDKDIIPFSVGRRSCPGESLARMELFLFIVNLLHRYTFSPPEDIEMPDYRQGIYNIIKQPVLFPMIVRRR